MKEVTEKAYAKVNLCLEVVRRAENGCHFIKSVMQSVNLCDVVTVEKASSISLLCDAPDLPRGEGNLAFKAAAAFFNACGASGGARIRLYKRIPVCAGLGGGSADAAAVLRALNALYGKPLGKEELLAAAASLGADVPFCVFGGTAIAEGFGEKLSPLPQAKLYYVLITDKTRLSTPLMYAALDERGRASPVDADGCIAAVRAGEAGAAARLAGNSFYRLAAEKCPAVAANAARLAECGADGVCITGKGPTVFGAFEQREKALSCAERLCGVFCQSALIGE